MGRIVMQICNAEDTTVTLAILTNMQTLSSIPSDEGK
jgi:hypothetical protein